MLSSKAFRILLLLTSGSRNIEVLVLLVIVLLLIAFLANLTNNLIMEVMADFSCDNTVSSTDILYVDEESSESVYSNDVVHEKIYFDLRSTTLPGHKDSSSISSSSSGSDEEFYAAQNTITFSARSNFLPFQSPSDLLQSIMEHIFKIAKRDVHRPSQQLEHLKSETKEKSMNVKSYNDSEESQTSYIFFNQDIGDKIKQELPLCSPVINSTHITKRKARTEFFDPLNHAEQDFIEESLQDSALQSAVLLNKSNDCNGSPLEDSVETSRVQTLDDKEWDQESKSCSEKLPVSDDLRSTVCPFCKKDFIYKYRRDRHMVSQACKRSLHTRCLQSAGNEWTCELCPNMVFSTKKEATQHALIHKVKPRTCSICEEDFRTRTASQLLQHTRKYHPEFFF